MLRTDLQGLPEPRRGKVREVYDLGNELLIVATDRISAFDVIMANGVPDKGRILTHMSGFWFERLSDVCPHHVISTDDLEVQARLGDRWMKDLAGRSTLAVKARPLAIECVARGYLTGSLYKEYRAQGGTIHGLTLPAGLRDGDRLPTPIFTPATKAEAGHDENLSFDQAAEIVGFPTAEKVRDLTLTLYGRAAAHAESCGLILADTKFEFGWAGDDLIWIDEALTPDSSRYWPADGWQPGVSLPSYDKQFVRDYLESIGWDKQPPGPALPEEVVQKTREKYLEAYRLITSREMLAATP